MKTKGKKLAHSAECDKDGNCPLCHADFAECECPAPAQEDEFECDDADGTLWAQEINKGEYE